MLWVRPGSSRDSLGWDAWRGRWVVACRAPPSGGKANREVARLLAGWLGVPPSAVRWLRAGSSAQKELLVSGIDPAEADRRLRRQISAEPLPGRRPNEFPSSE